MTQREKVIIGRVGPTLPSTFGRHGEKAGAARSCGFQSGDDDKPPALIYEGTPCRARRAVERTWRGSSGNEHGYAIAAVRQQRYTPFGGNVVDKGR